MEPWWWDIRSLNSFRGIHNNEFWSFRIEKCITEGAMCELLKSLRGLKQVPREWNKLLHSWLLDFGLKQPQEDSCFDLFHENHRTVSILTVYVDDLTFAGKVSSSSIQDEHFKAVQLQEWRPAQVHIKNNHESKQIRRNFDDFQSQYARDVLERFSMTNCVEFPLLW